ncbi:MAG: nucleotidyl transferase AbiEii/AbiGii toxin family protein [Thiobacillus sp.]|nr:nucleotidyl transferase AbiEii/AbiGii toxin family protein [Thiobacillus sp.]
MAKSAVNEKNDELIALEKIKKLTVTAMFSDDELLDQLVLKGGNAMALIHKLTSRESVDLDFSMRHDFLDGTEAIQARIERALQRTFRPAGYEPFDFKMEEKPAEVSPDLAGFWGGYGVEFKLVPNAQFAVLKDDLPKLRNAALSIGQGRKFFIDISRFEYVDDKESTELDGYRIYVYSPLMIACEKLRAICQQMNEYAPVVKRNNRPGSQRARDFFDIHTLVEGFGLDMLSPKALDITRQMFELKHVELAWLGNINSYREFHRQGFPSVKATVSRDFDLQEFDFYVDYVVKLANNVLTEALATPA